MSTIGASRARCTPAPGGAEKTLVLADHRGPTRRCPEMAVHAGLRLQPAVATARLRVDVTAPKARQ
jgi:hypothetical protein